METIEVNRALSNASRRCAQIAEGERLMGHPESAATYYTLAAEFQKDLEWLYEYMKRLHAKDLLNKAQRHMESLEDEGILIRG